MTKLEKGLLVGLAFSELLELTEEQLLAWGVTKGAARKLSRLVGRLGERAASLDLLQSRLDQGCMQVRSKKILT